jgi:hypothetical protein
MKVSIKKAAKQPKHRTSRPQYVLPELTTAEKAMCRDGKWLEAGRSYLKRNPKLMPYRCLVRVAEYYRNTLKEVLAKQAELRKRDARTRS